MDYKLLALDVDDTLIGSSLQISSRTKEAIKQARDAGVLVVISTGRMFRAIIPFLEELQLTSPAIVYNGAMVKGLQDEEPVIHHPLSAAQAREVASWVENRGSQLNAYLDDWLYVREQTPEVLNYMKKTRVDSTEVGPLGEFLQKDPTKLLVIHYDLPEIDQMREELQQKYGDILTITSSKPYFIEITALGISKGKALSELAAREGIAREEVIAIGDGLNDLSMIEWAGLGVAVENAHPQLKEAANYITTSCEQDGVARVIEKYILQRG